MPQNNQTLLEKTVADQWQTLPSGLTVLVRPMPGYSSTHVIYATKFGSIDRDFCLNGQTVHLPAGVAHFLEHKMFEDEDGDAFAKYCKKLHQSTSNRKLKALPSTQRPVPTPTPLPALTAPATCSPPPSSWTKAWTCCWAW